MHKELKIDFFPSGYSVENGASCLDLPIAIILGSICQKYYELYLFANSVDVNWNGQTEWIETRKKRVDLFNCCWGEVKCDSWKEARQNIIDCIDRGQYVLLPVTYKALFYCKDKAALPHMIVISGYDSYDDVFYINDVDFVKNGMVDQNKKYVVYQVIYSDYDMEAIWEKTQNTMNYYPFRNAFFYIGKEGEEVNYTEFAHDYIKKLKAEHKNSQFVEEVKRAVEIEKDDIGDYAMMLRRQYIGWCRPFIDLINSFDNVSISQKAVEWMENRNKIIFKLHMNLLRGLCTKDYVDSLVICASDNDRMLLEMIDKLV